MRMRLTKNFYLSEFDCHDGTPVPESYVGNVVELAKNLQVIRNEIGVPIEIISGYRTNTWNKKVGGAPKSKHKTAEAGDLSQRKYTPKQLHTIILSLIKQGRIHDGGLGLYKSFVHYDIGASRRWNG